MFTGIIQTVCSILAVRPGGGGVRLGVDLGELASEVKLGDSIAINGVCLTAAVINSGKIDFDVSGESLNRSTLKNVRVGDKVNIELAMKADGRFGGHIVQGHIDGVATVKAVGKNGDYWDISFTADENLLDEMVEKGSVAIAGVSLTISKIESGSFTVTVIPVTLAETILGDVKVGDKVNIETDIIGKVIKKQINKIAGSGKGGLTIDKLKEYGF